MFPTSSNSRFCWELVLAAASVHLWQQEDVLLKVNADTHVYFKDHVSQCNNMTH